MSERPPLRERTATLRERTATLFRGCGERYTCAPVGFAHIHPDAPAAPPGREDPCPCGSAKRVRRCCGVDHWRLVPRRGRRVGVTPIDLAERVAQLDGNWTVRLLAGRFLPSRLGGLPPSSLTEEERCELAELYGGETVLRALDVLQEAGYGARPARERTRLAHGARRTQRLERVRGKLPRALAKRLPTSADTHREGRNDGQDVYGEVVCSRTLRAAHLAVIAAAGGIWHSRNRQARPYAATTAGELAQLLTGRVRLGGKDVRNVHRLLAEVEDLELEATVNAPPEGGSPRRELAIPGSPIERVERRLPDGRWVGQADYAGALDALTAEAAIATAQGDVDTDAGDEGATIRIYLAAWVREEIAHGRPTLLDFQVWAHLRPVGQRLYAYLQASHRDDYDQAIQFYLGAPLRYTLGLHGRQHRAAASIRAALAQLYAADVRYHAAEKWSVRGRWANTNLPSFRIAPRRRPSAPTDRVRQRRKCPGERPAVLRGLSLREAREQTRLVRQALLDGQAAAVTALWPPGPESGA
jgi:hypothetical protein